MYKLGKFWFTVNTGSGHHQEMRDLDNVWTLLARFRIDIKISITILLRHLLFLSWNIAFKLIILLFSRSMSNQCFNNSNKIKNMLQCEIYFCTSVLYWTCPDTIRMEVWWHTWLKVRLSHKLLNIYLEI